MIAVQHWRAARPAHQEIEIDAGIRTLHMLQKQAHVAALGVRGAQTSKF